MELKDIIAGINAASTEQMGQIVAAVKNRQNFLARSTVNQMRYGARVKVRASNCAFEGIVKEIRQKTVLVQVLRTDYGKFAAGTNVRVPGNFIVEVLG